MFARKGVYGNFEITFYEISIQAKKVDALYPDSLQFKLSHNLRRQKTNKRAFEIRDKKKSESEFKPIIFKWNPPETIGMPVTLYGGINSTKFIKKLWKVTLMGLFENHNKVNMGSTIIDFREQLGKSSKEIVQITLNKGSGDFQCIIKTKIKVTVEDADDSFDITINPLSFFKIFHATPKNSCVLLLGTTGTGKTSTMNIFTGNDFPAGNSDKSVTEFTQLCKDFIHEDGPAWIDNPGWSDTEGLSDAETFKNLLRFMQEHRMYNIKALIWCVFPQPRMDATLQAQASFIDEFTVDKEKGRIWSNVIILAKGGKSVTEDCLGAVSAAKRAYPNADPKVLAYEFCNEKVIKSEISEDLRKNTLRMLTNEEIMEELDKALNKIENPVPVVLGNLRCEDCGQVGDPRLMDDFCHKEKVVGHTGELKQRYSKLVTGATVLGGICGIVALSAIGGAVPLIGPFVIIGIPFVIAPGCYFTGHRLINQRIEEEKNKIPFLRVNDMRWTCCGRLEKGKGCTFLCSCGKLWGNGPPCVMIRNPDLNRIKSGENFEVFIRDHNLKPALEDDDAHWF